MMSLDAEVHILDTGSLATSSEVAVQNGHRSSDPPMTDLAGVGPKQLHLNKKHKKNLCYLIANHFNEYEKYSLDAVCKIDEENIEQTLTMFNFEVITETNLTAEEIRGFFRERSLQDFSEDQCVIIYLISHGTNKKHPDGDEKNGVYMYGSDLEVVDVNALVDTLQNNSTLVRKPKLIFADFCRGDQLMPMVKENDKGVKAAGGRPKKRAKKADTLIYYATMNDYVACFDPLTDSTTGTFFTNALCKEMKILFQHNTIERPLYHLNDLIMKVNDHLSQHIQSLPAENELNDPTNLAQMSEACSTLTENIFFFSNDQCQ